jgi:hypothetical protein
MEKRRQRITEEDILMTESLITVSYGALKQSVVRAPKKALASIGDTMMKHPFETAAVAGGAGLGLYGLFSLMNRKGTDNKNDSGCKEEYQQDAGMEIISMLIPLVTPYLAVYLEEFMEGMRTGDQA